MARPLADRATAALRHCGAGAWGRCYGIYYGVVFRPQYNMYICMSVCLNPGRGANYAREYRSATHQITNCPRLSDCSGRDLAGESSSAEGWEGACTGAVEGIVLVAFQEPLFWGARGMGGHGVGR